MKKIRIALAQINPTVGDLAGNAKKIVTCIRRARRAGAAIVAFPELAITGYPPEDLLLKPHFIQDNIEILHDLIIPATEGITALTGFVDINDGIYNAAAVISDNNLIDIYHKIHLPNYGVFDEFRYFIPGKRYPVYKLGGIKLGINICEDIWHDKSPALIQAAHGAELILNINASPYHMGKALFREERVASLARRCEAAFAYVNMVGGQDELVFDGGSFASDRYGVVIARARQFEEQLLMATIELMRKSSGYASRASVYRASRKRVVERVMIKASPVNVRKKSVNRIAKKFSTVEEVYKALMIGTRDYVFKNGFKGVIVGMSGGIDSALVTTIAVDAIGKENVHGLFMPSGYTSKESYEDAYEHARNLGISIETISIDSIFRNYLKTLSGYFRGRKVDITEENLQARIRGNLLMAFSNKFGWLVLTTGNKSEMSVGYATLYGDMAGGFAVIKDVPKTLVYELCEWRNSRKDGGVIPERILWKEPTAELKPDQRDTDLLPPYQLLDPVLKAYVEEDRDFDEILKIGCDRECAQRVISMIDHSEYKRRQAPPGIKITPRAFGKDRRFPITNKYRSY